MNVRALLKYRSSIYTFCGLWIVFFHIYRRYGLPTEIKILSEFLSFGNIAVDIFMFLSGVCIYLAFDKKSDDLKNYYLKRAIALLIPYMLISLPYWVWRSAAGETFRITSFLSNISSISFWRNGIQTTWFVFAIAICYIIFPIFYKVMDKSFKLSICLLIGTLFFNVLGYMILPLYLNSAIAWTRLPIFVIGCISGKYIEKCDLRSIPLFCRRCLMAVAAVFLTIVMLVFPINQYVSTPILWLLYAPMTMLIILILTVLLSNCSGVSSKVIFNIADTLGGATLELYLIHVAMLNIIDYYKINVLIGYWVYLIVPILSLMLAIPLSKLREIIKSKLI